MSKNNHLPVATLLPFDVRDALVRASQVPDVNRARTIAIEKATELARRKYPKLFRSIK